MAFSKSIKKGQYALSCQLCEESTKIKWKCLECDLLMCTKCYEKVHPKFKLANQHQIVDIKDIASAHETESQDFTSVKCVTHDGQLCCLFCSECEQVVCPLCVAKIHNKHNMVEISEGFQKTCQKLKVFQEKCSTKNVNSSMLESIKTHQSSKYGDEKQKVLNQEEALISAVKKHTKKLVNDLDQKMSLLTNSIAKDEKFSLNSQEMMVKISSALEAKNVGEIFKVAEDCKNMSEEVNTDDTKNSLLPTFAPGEIYPSVIESIHGSFRDTTSPFLQFQTIQEYITDLPVVNDLLCCKEGTLWINNYKNKILQNVTLVNNKLHVNTSMDLQIQQMALTDSEDILISTFDNRLRMLNTKNGKVQDSEYNVSPLVTTTVYVSKDKVIVGARERGPAHPAKGPRIVIVMNKYGQQLTTHHLDNNNKPLFTYPFEITADRYNHLYIIDILSSGSGILTGRVVILGQTGEVLNMYTGLPGSDYLQKPADLVTTESDKIILSEAGTNTFHILNTKGQCIQYQNTAELGIHSPAALAMDNSGMLYIGCERQKGSKDNGKLYKVKISLK